MTQILWAIFFVYSCKYDRYLQERSQDSVPSLIHGKYEGQGTDIFPGDEYGQQAKRSNVPLQYIPLKIKKD